VSRLQLDIRPIILIKFLCTFIPNPEDDGRDFIKLYALDTVLSLGSGATKAQVEAAMQGHILAKAQLMATYKR
jgi:phosphatidylethanolamine-binding protein (PEBP) family uncharacterized protein